MKNSGSAYVRLRARNPSPLPPLTAAGYRLPSPREPRSEKHRAATHSPKTRQTTARCGRQSDICHDSSSGNRQNVRGRHTMNLRVFMKCTLQNEDFSAKRLLAPRK